MSLRERKKSRSRIEIMEAARELIHEQGYDNARMRDIAAMADISYQTLYNYFPTKGSILRALLSGEVTAAIDDIQALVARYEGNLLAALSDIVRADLQALEQGDRELWRIALIEVLKQTNETRELYDQIEHTAYGILVLLLTRAREFGELDPAAPINPLADALFSIGWHNIFRYMLDPTVTTAGATVHVQEQITLLLTPYLR